MKMIEDRLGVSMVPSRGVREEAAGGKLAQVRMKVYDFRRSVALVSLSGTPAAPIRAFLRFDNKTSGKTAGYGPELKTDNKFNEFRRLPGYF